MTTTCQPRGTAPGPRAARRPAPGGLETDGLARAAARRDPRPRRAVSTSTRPASVRNHRQSTAAAATASVPSARDHQHPRQDAQPGHRVGRNGVVDALGPDSATTSSRSATPVTTLVSLTLTLLGDHRRAALGRLLGAGPLRGHAILFDRTIVARSPTTSRALPRWPSWTCGAPALTSRVVRRYVESGHAPTVAVIGGAGRWQPRRRRPPCEAARTVGVVPVEARGRPARAHRHRRRDRDLADARDPVALRRHPQRSRRQRRHRRGLRRRAGLSTARSCRCDDGGTIISMATSFARPQRSVPRASRPTIHAHRQRLHARPRRPLDAPHRRGYPHVVHRAARVGGTVSTYSPGQIRGPCSTSTRTTIRRAAPRARAKGAGRVGIAKKHTTVSVERAVLRLAGLEGADVEGHPWVNRLVDVVSAGTSVSSTVVSLPVWDAMLPHRRATSRAVAQQAAAGIVSLARARGRETPRGGEDRRVAVSGGHPSASTPSAPRATELIRQVRRPARAVDPTSSSPPATSTRTCRRPRPRRPRGADVIAAHPLHRPVAARLRARGRRPARVRRHLRDPGELPPACVRGPRRDEARSSASTSASRTTRAACACPGDRLAGRTERRATWRCSTTRCTGILSATST